MRAIAAVVMVVTSQLVGAATTAPLEVRLSCPARYLYLDRIDVKGDAYEEIAIQAKPLDLGKDKITGKPQTAWVTDAKITSNKRVYEAHLLANGPEYAVVAYADLLREGISGSVLTIIFQIDLATLRLKRTITFFPAGKDFTFEGVCKKL